MKKLIKLGTLLNKELQILHQGLLIWLLKQKIGGTKGNDN
jgi:hypothetical protein